MSNSPDIVLIMADDMGFSDLGCYGGEIETPALDGLAAGGTRMTQFYNTARCSPSRAALLTGLHPHQVGIGILTNDDGPEGYPGNLSESCVTLAEAVKEAGYGTYMAGKWHVANDVRTPNGAWPTRRGFDRYYGVLSGGCYYQPPTLVRDEKNIEHEPLADDSFYLTDAISDHAIAFVEEHDRLRGDQPLFLYLAHFAPHWPLHALPEDIARYEGRFDKGWGHLREQRLERLVADGIIDPDAGLSDPDPAIPDWQSVEDASWEARRMEVYAAQVDRMDQGIGRLLAVLERLGRLDNTIVVFLSDNGGSAEEFPPDFAPLVEPLSAEELAELRKNLPHLFRETTRQGQAFVPGNRPGLMPGPETTYQSYGRPWANLSNTPFREYKSWVHEGGIASPFIVHWPEGLPARGDLCRTPSHITDVMPTLLDAAGVSHPAERKGRRVPPMSGHSLLPALRGEPPPPRPLFWEHEGNCAVRLERWKLVKKFEGPWELYDIDGERAERNDLSAQYPEVVTELADAYTEWADRVGVIPYDRIVATAGADGEA